MKGYKDKSGKFRPTGSKSKSALKKSDVRKKIEIVDMTKEPLVKKSDGTYELSANDKLKMDAFFSGTKQPTLPRNKGSIDRDDLRDDLDRHSPEEKKLVLQIYDNLGYENLDADGKFTVDYLRGKRNKTSLDDGRFVNETEADSQYDRDTILQALKDHGTIAGEDFTTSWDVADDEVDDNLAILVHDGLIKESYKPHDKLKEFVQYTLTDKGKKFTNQSRNKESLDDASDLSRKLSHHFGSADIDSRDSRFIINFGENGYANITNEKIESFEKQYPNATLDFNPKNRTLTVDGLK